MNEQHAITLSMHEDQIPKFFQLLQRGFLVKARLGCDVKTLLCREIGLNPKYLEERVQTIFLDGKPVDDVDYAAVREGSTLALSAAMPGLVGATFRRGGYYAAMRSQITHRKEKTATAAEEGTFTLKLFNLVMDDLGPIFLQRGIELRGDVLEDFLKGQSPEFWAGCRGAQLDGIAVEPVMLPAMECWGRDTPIHLQVVSVEEAA